MFGAGAANWSLRHRGALISGADFSDSARGFLYEYGFRAGLYWTRDRHWQVGVDGRYLIARSQVGFDTVVSDSSGTDFASYSPAITLEGLGISLSVGYRF